MEYIDSPDSVAGLFTDGTAGVAPPTVVWSKWLNAVQTEIVGIIEDAGLTPDNTQQLLAALRILLISQAQAGEYDAGNGVPRVVFRKRTIATVTTSELLLTINAAWDGSKWVKDVADADAYGFQIGTAKNSTGPTYTTILTNGFLRQTGSAADFTDTTFAAVTPFIQSTSSIPASPWINTGGSLQTMKYWRNAQGETCLQGCLSHGGGGSGPTVDPLGTLAAEYRPAKDLRFPSSYLDTTYKFCTILITAAGVITSDAAVGAQVRLDGIRFPIGV